MVKGKCLCVNENGCYFVDICAEGSLFLVNTFFQHKMIRRYTWIRNGGKEEQKALTMAVDERKVEIGCARC